MEEARIAQPHSVCCLPRPSTDMAINAEWVKGRHPLARPCRSAIGRGRQQEVALGRAAGADEAYTPHNASTCRVKGEHDGT